MIRFLCRCLGLLFLAAGFVGIVYDGARSIANNAVLVTSVSDVAEYMAVEHSTASRTVGAVVSAGLLTKAFASDDQRRCVLVLTELGRNALATVTERRRELVAETIADWPDADVDTLVVLLERLTERFESSAGR